jgi:hypothetical protein
VFRVEFNPQGERREAARACEAEVFLNRFGNTAEQMIEEYGPYEHTSVFLTVTDPDDAVVAAARFITPGPAGLKTLNDVARAPWHTNGIVAAAAAGIDLTATWDVATISVRRHRAFFNTRLSAALYHGISLALRANKLHATVAILDTAVRGMHGRLGITYRALPDTVAAPYLGSPSSTPVYAFFDEQMCILRQLRPDRHSLFALGVGLEDIAVPPLDDFRLR